MPRYPKGPILDDYPFYIPDGVQTFKLRTFRDLPPLEFPRDKAKFEARWGRLAQKVRNEPYETHTESLDDMWYRLRVKPGHNACMVAASYSFTPGHKKLRSWDHRVLEILNRKDDWFVVCREANKGEWNYVRVAKDDFRWPITLGPTFPLDFDVRNPANSGGCTENDIVVSWGIANRAP